MGGASALRGLGLAGCAALGTLGCRVPAEPPGGYAPRGPESEAAPAIAEDEGQGTLAEADLRPLDPEDGEGDPGPELADCLADFSRARGYGEDPAQARTLAAACDGAGIASERCRPEGWLTREAAECLATARMDSPDATLASELSPDRAAGRMVWTIGGSELLPEDVELRWEVELDATTGVVLRTRRSELVTNPWSAEP